MPEPTEKPRERRGLPLGLPCLSPLYFCSIFEGLHRTIRPKFKIFSCMRSASVDSVRSRLSLVDFSSGSAVPSEKCAKNRKIFKFLQISSKLHRLNRWKDGIFSCMRSARVDWGKSHRQIIKFSRGLRFRAKICIFSTRNHAKIILFDFFRTFRVMAPAATPQKYKNNTKYASDLCPFTARHNYAYPRTVPLCLWIAFFEQMREIGCPFMK